MSIIIKGMEMPENCGMCNCNSCNFCDFTDRYIIDTDQIDAACPLVEIPKGARLIDGNALVDSLGISDRDDYCEEIIDEQPTVFEEDEE